MKIKLNKPFAANSGVDEFDTRQIKKALNRLGYYKPYKETGITGIPDAGVFTALKSFQKDSGLTPTGTAKPGDETVKALNDEFAKMKSGQYIWRTVGDKRVRPEHAALDGTLRDFSDSPDPGDDFNCRCWAEAIQIKNNCEEEEKEWINAEAELFIAQQNLKRIEKELRQLESILSEHRNDLEMINARIKKEKIDKGNARNKGAAAGITGGAILGTPTGPGSAMGLAGVGIGLGANAGQYIEEIGDAIRKESETDLSLGFKKQKLLKDIKDLQKSMEVLTRQINNELMPKVKKAEIDAKEKKATLRTCQEKHTG